MHKKENIAQTKRKQQNLIKIVLWVAMLLVLIFVVRQVVGPNTMQSNDLRPETELQSIEQQTQDLNADTQELESSLDQLRFEEDIRALRDE